MEYEQENQLSIIHENDLISVRKTLRVITGELGFSLIDTTRIVTAASELTRNILIYAGSGVMIWRKMDGNGRRGLELVFTDYGPGIDDVEVAMKTGFTTSKGLGLGLPGTKRLMDEMQIESRPGNGTTITVRKWQKR